MKFLSLIILSSVIWGSAFAESPNSSTINSISSTNTQTNISSTNTQTNIGNTNTQTNLCPVGPVNPGIYNNLPPGCYTQLVFSQTYEPEFCLKQIVQNDNPDLLNEFICESLENPPSEDNPYFRIHGLWLNLDSNTPGKEATPQYCTKEVFDFESLSLDLRRKMKLLYTIGESPLLLHEWEKHGTCYKNSPLKQEDFFQKTLEYNDKYVQARAFLNQNIGKSISYADLVQYYGNGNSGHLTAICSKNKTSNRQYISEIRTFWDLNDQPIVQMEKGPNTCDPSQPIYLRSPTQFISSGFWQKKVKDKYQKPINVAFEVDFSIWVSRPGTYYLNVFQNKTGGKDFWNAVNNGLDEYSLPKQVASKLIAFHQNRGDNIYFIVKRPQSPTETVTSTIQKSFKMKKTNPAIFIGMNGSSSKTLKDNNVQVYYADSDEGIWVATELGIDAVRILRTSFDTNSIPAQNIGEFNEQILINSEQ